MAQQEPRAAANLETGQTDGQIRLHSEVIAGDEFQPKSWHVSSGDPKWKDQTENSGYLQIETISGPDRNQSEISHQDQPNCAMEANACDSIADAAINVIGTIDSDDSPDKRTEGSDLERNAVGKDSGRLARSGGSFPGNDGLTTSSDPDENQYGYSYESGHDSALLLPPSSTRRKGRSNIQPLNVPNNPRDGSRLLAVKYTKSGIKQSRELSDAGGEKRLKGVVHSGSDVIEHLPDDVEEVETPEPLVQITSTTPDEQPEVSDSWTNSLEVKCLPSCNCFGFLGGMLEGQFMKAPLFYSLSSTVTFFALVIFLGSAEDLDILASIIATIVVCILVTIFIPRGKWAKGGQKQEGVGGRDSRHSDESGTCGSCWRRREPLPVQRSQYYRLTERDTVFEHEVADISKIDPKDCPQIRMVEGQDILEPGSPDFPPKSSELNVDIHAPGSPINPECASGGHAAASKSVPGWTEHGKAESTSETLKSTLVSLLAETVAYDAEDFECEHRGLGLACSCFADRQRNS